MKTSLERKPWLEKDEDINNLSWTIIAITHYTKYIKKWYFIFCFILNIMSLHVFNHSFVANETAKDKATFLLNVSCSKVINETIKSPSTTMTVTLNASLTSNLLEGCPNQGLFITLKKHLVVQGKRRGTDIQWVHPMVLRVEWILKEYGLNLKSIMWHQGWNSCKRRTFKDDARSITQSSPNQSRG